MENLVVTLPNSDFWRGKRVLLTGHTGFKGAWLALWLSRLGARVHAIALPPESPNGLWLSLTEENSILSRYRDLRHASSVRAEVFEANPEIVFHLAAEALVRRAHRNPAGTWSTNIGGTTNLMAALEDAEALRAVVVVTSDKVYDPSSGSGPHQESDPLGGPGVYAASKAAQDMLARSWDRQRLRNARVAVARAGNVIGGGDRGEDRLAPDTVRAIFTGRPLRIRHPDAVRPWQHVLEPLAGYLAYARALASSDTDLPDALNFGPDPADHWPVKRMVETMYRLWPSKPKIVEDDAAGPPETKLLRLDAGLANRCLGWKPVLPIEVALDWTVAWYRDYEAGEDGAKLANSQIDAYERRMGDLQATR